MIFWESVVVIYILLLRSLLLSLLYNQCSTASFSLLLFCELLRMMLLENHINYVYTLMSVVLSNVAFSLELQRWRHWGISFWTRNLLRLCVLISFWITNLLNYWALAAILYAVHVGVCYSKWWISWWPEEWVTFWICTKQSIACRQKALWILNVFATTIKP